MRLGPRPFLDVHPLVGGAQHLVRGHAAAGPADAETGPDTDRAAVHADRRDDRVAQPDREVGGVRRAQSVREDDEFVTTQPSDGVTVPDARREPPRHLDQDRVARVVPEPVVDRLEAVEVAEEHREPLGPVVDVRRGRHRVHVVVVRAVRRDQGPGELEGVGRGEAVGSVGPEVRPEVGLKAVLTRTTRLAVHRVPLVGGVQGLDRGGPYGLWPATQPRAEPGAQLGAVGQAGQGVVAGAVGELELVPLALLDVLDVGEQEAGPVGGVGHDGIAERDPYVRAVAPPEPQLSAAALGGGAQQGADVLGVDQVGEGVPAQYGRGPAEQPAQCVVGAQQPAVLVAAHLGDGHAAGRVLEGLAERLFTGPQGLLFALQPDQGALHVRAEPGVADRDRGLEGVHLERLAAPGSGPAAVAGPVHRDDTEEFPAGRVHRRVQPVLGVPFVFETRFGALRVPLGDVVLHEDPALGVRDEAEAVPVLAHRQPAFPGGAGSYAAGDEGFGGGVAGEGGDDEVTVRTYEVDTGEFVAEAHDDAVHDGLQSVRQAPGRIELGHHPVQLPQGRKTDVRLRLGLHCSLSPRPRQQLQVCHRRFVAVSRPLNHSELCGRYTGSTNLGLCDSSHMR